MLSRYVNIGKRLGANYNLCSKIVSSNLIQRNINIGITHLKRTRPVIVKEIIEKYDEINLKALNRFYNRIDFENISNEEAQLLLKCCGSCSVNSSLEERSQMCTNIYQNLMKFDKLSLDIITSYIRTCTENSSLINSISFLESIKLPPDFNIFKYLLENVCEAGDLGQAFMLLENMKQFNFAIDEDIFNNLALVHTMKGGLSAGEKVLETMKTAQIPITDETYLSILKGIIRSQNDDDLRRFLDNNRLILTDKQSLLVLKELGMSQRVDWLDMMKLNFSNIVVTREFINEVKKVVINLVHLKKSDSAVKLYTYFKESDENYGLFILEEMLHSKADPKDVILTAKFFLENYNNHHIFANLAECALKNKYFDIVWKLFENLNVLRPHYFWPLLINARNDYGEKGVLEVIEKINKLNCKLDSESLEYYVIPSINLEDLKISVEKLKTVGFSVKEIITPMLIVLIKNNYIKKALKLIELYNVQIQVDKVYKTVFHTWKYYKDPNVAGILQKICESSHSDSDLVGDFLVMALRKCINIHDYRTFSTLLKNLHLKNLKITTTSAEILRETLDKQLHKKENKLSEEILDGIDKILEFKLKTEVNHIPHPRDMSLDELQCHLVELQEKGMETRGVLRRLIQSETNSGNYEKVTKYKEQFLDSGYKESLGMKSSLMYTYVKKNELDLAFDIYKNIKKTDPTFAIDEHKIVDLATLLVKNNRIGEAYNILEESNKLKLYKGTGIQRNCIELLNSINDEDERIRMLDFLVEKSFCKYTNVMLGPLVRIHLNKGDLEKATQSFITIVDKYKCTPLQFELIREIAKSKNEELLQQVLDWTSQIHGPLSTQVSLIGVLAEIGEEKILTKILSTTQFQIRQEVNKRCIRWIKEGKADALITLAKSSVRLPSDLIDLNFIHECILKVFSFRNDCESAIKFYESLLEQEVAIDKKLEHQLCVLLKQNNYMIPNSLRINK